MAAVSNLHSYQKRAIAWCRERESGYLAIDMGLGKTRIILELARDLDVPLLVVAPLRVATNSWPKEILKWTPERSYTVIHGKDKLENVRLTRNIYIINYDGLTWLEANLVRRNLRGGLIVFDEATAIKAPSSKRTKAARAIRALFERCYCLSALPSPNGLHDLWSQYYAMDYGATLGSRYTQFMNRHFRTLENRMIVPLSKDTPKSIARAISKSTFRLDANDYAQMPDFVDNLKVIELDSRLFKAYASLEEEFVLELASGTSVTALSAATLSMKLRQFCQGAMYTESGYEVLHSLKLDMLQDILDELNGEPTLVPIQFKFELAEIKKRFGNVPAITGGLSAKQSNHWLDAWNASDLPMLVCHPASLSHGVNLQAGGHHITWLALTWNYEHYQQLNGRLRRQGQQHPVVRTHVVVERSIEQRMAQVLTSKGASQQSLLDALRTYTNKTL